MLDGEERRQLDGDQLDGVTTAAGTATFCGVDGAYIQIEIRRESGSARQLSKTVDRI
jgi:hypothetical protein